ncbi:MAG: hypothetical protein RLY47_41 [Candidatus Parcubacteria bacterium]|jgi:hypothetical protein
MKNKVAFFFLAIVGTVLLFGIGFVMASIWGGNHAVDFVLLDWRGYEATGMVGAMVGLIIGLGLTFFSYRRIF